MGPAGEAWTPSVQSVAVAVVVALIAGGGLVVLGPSPPSSASSNTSNTSDEAGPQIALKAATFDPVDGEPGMSDALRVEYAANETGHFLVQFDEAVRPDWKQDLQAEGIEVLGFLPEHAFRVKATNETVQPVANHSHVRAVEEYHPHYKLSADARDRIGEAERFNVTVSVHESEDVATVQRQLEARNATIHGIDHDSLRASVNGTQLKATANLEGVRWLDTHTWADFDLEFGVPLINARRGSSQPVSEGVWFWDDDNETFKGTTGHNRTIAVVDSGLDLENGTPAHPDFEGRLEAYYTYEHNEAEDEHEEDHGTSVAGIALGKGSQDNRGNVGVAPESNLIVQDQTDGEIDRGGEILDDYCADATEDGASISTNSWGVGDSSNYTSRDEAFDECARDGDPSSEENEPLLVVTSAGNAGGGGNESIGSPGTGKNMVTVGASWNNESLQANVPAAEEENNNEVWSKSSRGPTDDGRVKPDIVAPGEPTYTTCTDAGSCDLDYHKFGATSGATPYVSGAAALIEERFVSEEGVVPSPALTKAILVNGAQDLGYGYGTITNTSPDMISDRDEGQCGCNIQGWGRVNVTRSLGEVSDRVMEHQEQDRELSTGETQVFDLVVEEVARTKVAATWTDEPGDPAAEFQIVNDLNLVVRGPSQTRWVGNVFPDDANASQANATDLRPLNTLENVFLNDPSPGTYEVQVHAGEAIGQDFALAASGNVSLQEPTGVSDDMELELFVFNSDPGLAVYSTGESRSANRSILLAATALDDDPNVYESDANASRTFTWSGGSVSNLEVFYNWTQDVEAGDLTTGSAGVRLSAVDADGNRLGEYRYVTRYAGDEPQGNVTLVNVDQDGEPTSFSTWLSVDRNVTADWSGLNWSKVDRLTVEPFHEFSDALHSMQYLVDDLAVSLEGS
jgi:subtilisin family serine protease